MQKLKNLLKKKENRNISVKKLLIGLHEIATYLLIKYFAYKKWFKTKNDEFLFKYIYKNGKSKVKIILNDFGGYPLYRDKVVCGYITIKCGIGNLFESMARFKAGVQFDIILIINSVSNAETREKWDLYEALQKKYLFIEKIMFRDNTGFDFGAYNMGYQYLRGIGYKGDVLFMNSSARGPYNDYWLLKYSYLFHRGKNIGLCGISLNSHTTHLSEAFFKPHVQSFFMYTNMEILMRVFKNCLPGAGITSSSQLDIISNGEIQFSQKILDNGYGICSKLFEDFVYYKGKRWRVPFGETRMNKLYSQFANKI